jgi:hypothetical protein
MFKVNHLFGGNGSVPSIGGVPSLASALAQVERAEAALHAARALARAAAKRERVSVRGLFEDSKFILRATGERWCDTARSEGECAGMNRITDMIISAQGEDPAKVRAEIKARLERERPAREAADAKWQDTMRESGFLAAVADKDYEKAAQIYRQISPERFGISKGQAIVRAAARARMSADAAGEVPEPEKGSLAAQIVRAGARRRGEIQ